MTEGQAIEKALAALRIEKTPVGSKPVVAIHKERHMQLGKNRSGWLVVVPLDVPYGFEPDTIFIEVYEPEGEVFIPDIL